MEEQSALCTVVVEPTTIILRVNEGLLILEFEMNYYRLDLEF